MPLRTLESQDELVCSLLSLPFHLLVAIFSHLDNSNDLYQARLVSKDVNAAATLAVTKLSPSALGESEDGNQHPLARFTSVAALDLSRVERSSWTEGVLQGLAEANSLTSLKLGHKNPITSSGARYIAALRTLHSIELLESPLGDTDLAEWSVLEHLTSISLRASSSLTDEGLQTLGKITSLQEVDLGACYAVADGTLTALGILPGLRKIDLAACDGFSSIGIAALGQSGTVRTLLLPACWHVDNIMLGTVATAMPLLECLSLFEAGETVTDDGLVQLSVLTKLTALDLGYSCWCHTSSGLRRVLKELPALCMLSLAGAEGSCDDTLEAAASLKQLTSLDVSECQRVTAAGMRQVRRLPTLLELNAGWNLRLSDATLSDLPQSLTKIDLSYCGDLSHNALAAAAALPNLSILIARRCFKIGDASLEALSRSAGANSTSMLRQLDVSYTAVTSRGLRHLSSLTCLSALNLAGCPRAATVLGLGALSSMRSLHCLDASNNPRLDDGCMQALSFVSGLRSVSLRGCPRVSDHGVLAFVRAPGLETLDITGCHCVTSAAVEKLKSKLPLLRKVSVPCHQCDGGRAWQVAHLPPFAQHTAPHYY